MHFGSVEGGYRDLCNRCFNQKIAAAGGIDFSHVQFEPLIRRALAQQHLKPEPLMPGLHIADFPVRGRFTWDDNDDGRLPMLVIDGKEISWERFGRMMMGFEGWQFKWKSRTEAKRFKVAQR